MSLSTAHGNREVDQPERYRVNDELTGHELDARHLPQGQFTKKQVDAMDAVRCRPSADWKPRCACSWEGDWS